MLADLGVAVAGGQPPLNRTVAWRGGRRYRLPVGGTSLLATGLLGVRDKLETGRFLAGLSRLDTAPLQHVTIRDWLDHEVHSPRVRQLLEALFRVTSYANAPVIASAGAHLDQLRAGSRQGVRYLDGGWQTIVDGLRQRAIDQGVCLRTAAAVDAVTPSPGGWRLRLRSGEELCADAVILALAPGQAARLVDAPAQHELARWAVDATPVQVAALDVALSKTPRPKQNYSIGIDRPLYFSVHTAAARLGPPRGAVIHAAMYLPHGDIRDYAGIERELEWLVDQLQPGWRDLLVHRRFLPTSASRTLSSPPPGRPPRPPRPRGPGAEGLFVAGDWVGPTGMLADAAWPAASRPPLAAEVEPRRLEPARVA
jgi:phytoene dehydrogenase-like protein